MALFRRQKAQESLKERLLALEERCDSLERRAKGLRLEWEELYDKVRHQMSRISRRVASSNSEQEPQPPLPAGASEVPGSDPVSQSIMLRRARQASGK